MKNMKKILSLVLVLCMMFSLCAGAFAADLTEEGTEDVASVETESTEELFASNDEETDINSFVVDGEDTTVEEVDSVDAVNAVTETDISVEVNGTNTATLEGTYTSFTTDPNSKVATATLNSSVKYTGQSVTLSSNNYNNYIGYYYSTDNGTTCYEITSITRSSGYGQTSYTIYYNGTSVTLSPSRGSSSVTVTLYTAAAATTVTFKGVAVGTTTAVVGDIQYNITVIAYTPETSDSITVYQYISSNPVWDVNKKSTYPASAAGQTAAVNAGATKVVLSKTDANVCSENGIKLTDSGYVPAEGWWIYASEKTSTVYWKGVVHNSGIKQYGSQENYSANSGYDFNYIRYYNGEWETRVDEKSTWTAIPSGRELVAYYLQKTQVTTEVGTFVSDWAFTTADMPTSANSTSYMKGVSFAVVYPDDTMNPTAENIYASSTLLYWDRTPIRTLSFQFSEELMNVYDVEKITYTFGSRTNSSGTVYSNTDSSADGYYHWASTDNIKWNMVTDEEEHTWYDETTCWDETYGTDPIVDGSGLMADGAINMGTAKGNGVDSSNTNFQGGNFGRNQAILILVYLKVKTSEDNLNVQYWDDSNNSEITPASYQIAITNKAGEEKGTFVNRLKGNSATPVAGEELELDDTAYVVNAADVNRYFNKDLASMLSVKGTIYASGIYQYVKAEISADGKTLILHYNIDESKLGSSYVIDFGAKVEIPKTAVANIDYTTIGISSITLRNEDTATHTASTTYGTVTYANDTFTYTPAKVLQGVDYIRGTVTFTDNTTKSFNIGIYPATTVFYEEGFATAVKGFSGGSKSTETQAAEVLGEHSNVYGNDAIYDSNKATAYSGGSSAKATVSGSKETFDFTGTGVEIFASATATSGWLYIDVVDDAGKTVDMAIVNTKMVAGTTDATGAAIQQQGNAYNVPVYNNPDVSGSNTIKHYTVTVMKSMESTKEVMFDGFRVYNTLATSDATSVYVKGLIADNEDNPGYVELRNLSLTVSGYSGSEQVYKAIDTGKTPVYTLIMYDKNGDTVDISGTDIQTDLLNNGPKNEIYLAPGASLTFVVKSVREVQVGLKGVFGTTSFTAGTTSGTASTVDMFYKIQAKGEGSEAGTTYTIKNTSTSGILSVTQIKFSDEIAFLPIDAAAVTDALEAQGVTDVEVEENASLMISIKTPNGKLLASKTITVSGKSGEAYTFEKADVKAAVEELAAENNIQLSNRNSYKAITVNYGSNAAVSFKGSAK